MTIPVSRDVEDNYAKRFCENCRRALTPDNIYEDGDLAWCRDCAERLGFCPPIPSPTLTPDLRGTACKICGSLDWCDHKRDAYLGFMIWLVENGYFRNDRRVEWRTLEEIERDGQ